jgi:hypothetical protein
MEADLADKDRIDASELTEARLSADGTRLHLTLYDQAGKKVPLSLPTCCMNTLITALPGHPDPGSVHRLDSWTMGTSENGQDLLLTLRTPEGTAISFTLKPWQVEGIATIATYGGLSRPMPKIVH